MTTSPETRVTQDLLIQDSLTQEEAIASLGHYDYGWSDSDVAGAAAKRGLSEAVVRDISAKKSEPEWMLDVRLKASAGLEREAVFVGQGHKFQIWEPSRFADHLDSALARVRRLRAGEGREAAS